MTGTGSATGPRKPGWPKGRKRSPEDRAAKIEVLRRAAERAREDKQIAAGLRLLWQGWTAAERAGAAAVLRARGLDVERLLPKADAK